MRSSFPSNQWLSCPLFALTTIISAEERFHKPQPEIFRVALDRLGMQPEEALFIDDEERYIAAVQALGMYAVQFRDSMQVIGEIRQLLETV